MQKVSSFSYLNLTQFFSALNDNIYKLLLIFLLINLKGAENSNTILSLAGAVFVVPFILFASLSGTLADRYSKRSIIFYTRLLEIATMALGVVAFALKSVLGAYTILFLMATQSALFSPAKYGIVPEIVPQERISRSNGILTATTYLAIILGTFLASFLTQITARNFVLASLFCVGVALLGFITSIGIKKTAPQAPLKKLSWRFLYTILNTLKKAHKQRYLLVAILCGAYFLFIGSYTQLNIIPFTIQSLKLTEIQGGYLFLMCAVGIGIGSLCAGKLSFKQVELGFIPLAALAIGVSLIFIALFSTNFLITAVCLIVLGVAGGFYIVPVDAFIQVASPYEDRGQNIAAANFMSFVGVIFASLLLAFLGNGLGLSAADGFLTIGFATLVLAAFLMLLLADQLLRLILSKTCKLFGNITVIGQQYLEAKPLLIVGERRSWLDTVIMLATLPRLIRIIIPVKQQKLAGRAPLYRLMRIIPFDETLLNASSQQALDEVEKELDQGHSVCVLQPPGENLQLWNPPTIRLEIRRATPDAALPKIKQLQAV